MLVSEAALDSFDIPHLFYLLEEKYNFPFASLKGAQPKLVGDLALMVDRDVDKVFFDLEDLGLCCRRLVCGPNNLPNGCVVDLRLSSEIRTFPIPGAIDCDKLLLPKILDKLSPDSYIVCSTSGARALSAALYLSGQGFYIKAYQGCWRELFGHIGES